MARKENFVEMITRKAKSAIGMQPSGPGIPGAGIPSSSPSEVAGRVALENVHAAPGAAARSAVRSNAAVVSNGN